ncbi:MAG TPA: hypothetical protein VIP53_03150 [Nitrososphaera sp.]
MIPSEPLLTSNLGKLPIVVIIPSSAFPFSFLPFLQDAAARCAYHALPVLKVAPHNLRVTFSVCCGDIERYSEKSKA